MVDELLDFKEKLDRFLHECFHSNEKFSNILKDSFENFINQRTNKPAELIGACLSSSLSFRRDLFFYVVQRRQSMRDYGLAIKKRRKKNWRKCSIDCWFSFDSFMAKMSSRHSTRRIWQNDYWSARVLRSMQRNPCYSNWNKVRKILAYASDTRSLISRMWKYIHQ